MGENTSPFEYLGGVKDYDGFDIIQTSDFIEMSSKSYISWLLKSHGWETLTPKQLPSENIALPKEILSLDPIPTTAAVTSINKIQVNREDGLLDVIFSVKQLKKTIEF